MGKKIAVILGSPDPDSFCRALADRYAESAEQAGNEVRYFRLGEIEFDPVLRHGYNRRQELEPGLRDIQSDHLVRACGVGVPGVVGLHAGHHERHV